MNKAIGATYLNNGRCLFSVWAPLKNKMILHIISPEERLIEMSRDQYGYFYTETNTYPGTEYYFRPDDEDDYPDPASRYQTQGVNGPSAVIDNHFNWTDNEWKNIPFDDLIIYELHIGTFTPEGTFEAIIQRLDELNELGINAIELMPVNQFSGARNWGYDAVFPYAVQNSYGGPEGLKKLVDTCHQHGIAVFLDLVYNHLGPEGNYFPKFAPYFNDHYSTPWGDALNYDAGWSDGVRDFFSDNALYWFNDFHIDGLRLDAIHMVFDNGAIHFWELLHNKVKKLESEKERNFYLMAESDLNSPRVIKNPDSGGYGFNAQWLDDFHHALYTILDPEGIKRYEDFGKLDQLVKAFNDGFVLSGEWVKFRKRKFGRSSAGIPGNRFIVFNQNHDQIGNRVGGERLCMLVDEKKTRLAAAAVLLSPYIPLLFMGEEYADQTPFFYFVNHSGEDLIKAVQQGRLNEFKDLGFDVPPPDPQDEKTFKQSVLHWNKREEGKHKRMLDWHKRLIELRKTHPLFKVYNKDNFKALNINDKGIVLIRHDNNNRKQLLCFLNFSGDHLSHQLHEKKWTVVLDSEKEKTENIHLGNNTIEVSPWSVLVVSTED